MEKLNCEMCNSEVEVEKSHALPPDDMMVCDKCYKKWKEGRL